MADILREYLMKKYPQLAPAQPQVEVDPQLEALQEQQKQKDLAVGLLEGATTIGKAAVGDASPPAQFDTARNIAKQDVYNYLLRKKQEQDAAAEQTKGLQAIAGMEQSEAAKQQALEMAKERLDLQAQNTAIAKERLEASKDMFGTTTDRLSGNKLNDYVEKYGKRLETKKIPEMTAYLAQLDALVAKYKNNIPGAGIAFLDWAKPNPILSEDAIAFRKTLRKLVDEAVRQATGAQVNEQELKTYKEIYGDAQSAITEKEIKEGLNVLRTAVGAIKKNIDKSFTPQVRETFEENAVAPTPTPTPAPAPAQAIPGPVQVPQQPKRTPEEIKKELDAINQMIQQKGG